MPSNTSTTKQRAIVKTKNSYDGVDLTNHYVIIDKFLGYRSREDKTMLSPGYMIPGSQNVLIDITGRLKSRQGFTLDGQADTTLASIKGWFDWEEHKGGTINLRSHSGKLQFRYKVGTTVTWTDIFTTLSTTNPIIFCNYWNNTEIENEVIFVDGGTNVYKWNGATATFTSATTNTITIQGTPTIAELGFYASANKKLWLKGVEYTYTGISGSQFTGVTPDPTAQIPANTPAVSDLMYQSIITTASITGIGTGFKYDSVSNLDNQIYYGCLTRNDVYVSKINDFSTTAFTAPLRIVGEGALMTLRAPFVSFAPQEDVMYISAGKNQWYQTKKVLDSSNAKETFNVIPLKVSSKQGAISQHATSHDRNSVVYLSNETRFNTLGRVDNIYQTPMITDYSFPIAKDFDKYDFTNASIKYHKSFLYLALPVEGKWLILNMTDPSNVFWEAPQTGSFAGFSDIEGDIYAHGYATPETYKLFDGYNDNGAPILSRATLAYSAYGNRGLTKYFNEFWMDGYISVNTVLKIIYNFDLDGCATEINKEMLGISTNVCAFNDTGSLGKTSLGKSGLGTGTIINESDAMPPYFSTIKTSPRKDFYFFSPTFESYGTDYHWEIISIGALVQNTMYGSNNIKEN